MNRGFVIAIAGYKGSGKSVMARTLLHEHIAIHRGNAVVLKLAQPLKDMLRAIGLGYNELEGHAKEAPCTILCGRTPRHAMQTLGTEWRNMIHPHLFVRIWRQRAAELVGASYLVICDDLRFQHELEMIREFPSSVWFVERPGYSAADTRKKRWWQSYWRKAATIHPSEANYSFLKEAANEVIINDNSVDVLKNYTIAKYNNIMPLRKTLVE